MKWLYLLALAACYSPTVPTGAPCDGEHPCPRPLVCAAASGTCEKTDSDAASDAPADVAVDVPADAAMLANDLPGGAIDVTAGGRFTEDLGLAHDDYAQRGCDSHGGREVFYEVRIPAIEVYELDTFGSDFDSTIRVFSGTACSALANSAGGPDACGDDACNGPQSQVARELPAGTSCIVVDQLANQTTTSLVLNVTRGHHRGIALPPGPSTAGGDSCGDSDGFRGSCENAGGKDRGFFFTVCPGHTAHVSASTCADVSMVHYDTVLYMTKAGGGELVCIDDSMDTCAARPDRPDHIDGAVLIDAPAAGPGLFFLVLDGYEAVDCGGYFLTADLH